MRMWSLICVLLACLCAGRAEAKVYYFAASGDGADWFLDMERLEPQRKGIVSLWVLQVYFDADAHEQIKLKKRFYFFNCRMKAYAPRGLQYFAWRDDTLLFKEADIYDEDEPFEYRDIKPDTIIAEIHEEVCGERRASQYLYLQDEVALVQAVDRSDKD